MSLHLSQSKKVVDDFNKYSKMISEMPEGDLKSDTESLLKILKKSVDELDRKHDELIMKKEFVTSGPELRESILKARSKLESRYKDWLKYQQNS
jgi:hypothetical protein